MTQSPQFEQPRNPAPPAPAVSPGPHQDAVAHLQRQVAQLRGLAFGGVALGLVATALAAFGLARTPQAAVGAAVPATPAAAASQAQGQAAPAASATTVAIGKPADAGAAPSGTIVLGAPGNGNPVLDIYEDFQCPACEAVEQRIGPEVDKLVAGGQTEVRYHMMSFLDTNLKNDSSVRSANGGFCAHEQGKFGAWHDTLFAAVNRPPQEGVGWTDAQLSAFATQSGLDTTAWQACVSSKKYAAKVTDANQLSLQSGVTGTPTYKLNGTQLSLQSVINSGGLEAFVNAHR